MWFGMDPLGMDHLVQSIANVHVHFVVVRCIQQMNQVAYRLHIARYATIVPTNDS